MEPRRRQRAGRAWAHTWRLLVGLAIGSALTFGLYVMGSEIDPSWETRETAATWFLLVEAPGLLVCAVLYVVRHRSPLLVAGVIVAIGSFSAPAMGIVMLAVVSMATRRRWAEIGPVSVLWLGGGIVAERAVDTYAYAVAETSLLDDVGTLVTLLVMYALLAVTGMFIGGRRALIASLREQATIARREADARDDSARAAERNRIAREMHDVLAHRLSLVALHSGALEYRAGLDPEQVRQTAAVVRESAHEALGELREVLGLLRDTTTDDHSRPQPTLAQVDELVTGTRAAGSPVTFVLDHVGEDQLAQLPLSTSRHLYRVVQETLTNARKHAPGAPVHVRVHGQPGDRITLEVTNPVPARAPTAPLPTSGWGLTGLAERLRLTGGELDTRRTDGTFIVQAWLPWAAATEGQT